MTAELGVLDARGAAFRAGDRVPQSSVARVPFPQEFSRGRMFFFRNTQPNSGESGREEIPLLQLALIVNFRSDAGFIEPPLQRFSMFWFIECRYGQPFHNPPFS